MKRAGTPGIVFIALGAAFIAIGISRQRAFLAIGVAFLVIGFVIFYRRRRNGGST
jgi:LPXTG-motif cell wall-anchored protein